LRRDTLVELKAAFEQNLDGRTIAFQGSKLWVLNASGKVSGVDVPQGMNLTKFLDDGDFDNAYLAACLGVTKSEWRWLAMRALRAVRLDIAHKALARIKDAQYLDIVDRLQQRIGIRGSLSSTEPQQLDLQSQAELLAHEGHFNEAAKLYARGGMVAEAVRIFTDIRR
jgi:intraflagellar transport protein 122